MEIIIRKLKDFSEAPMDHLLEADLSEEKLEDFFIKHYNEPIFENGIQCRDMVRLNLKIKRDS